MDKALNSLQKPSVVHGLILAMVGLYWGLRVFAFSGLSADEAEQVLFAQSFQWGYDVANPPLYTWVLITLFALLGKSAGLVLAFKLAIVASIYAALYHCSRLVLANERRLDWALVGLSPVLFFFIGWHAIFNYSHSLLNALFAVFSFMALIKVIDSGRWRWYLILGLVAGLGLLTKYAFALFLIAALAAGLSLPQARQRLLSGRMLAALLVLGAVVAPHAAWLLNASDQVAHAVSYKLQTQTDAAYLSGVGTGFWNLLRAAFAFLSPFWLIALLVFPAAVKKATSTPDNQNIAGPLLGRTFIGFTLLLVGMVVIGGVSQFRPNYLFVLVLVPLWLFTRLSTEAAAPGKRRKVYAALIGVALVLSVGGLTGKALSDPWRCKKCLFLTPYEDIAKALQERGFTAGSVFATWHPTPLPGNLALYLPDARIISHKFTALKPPPRLGADGQCMTVWVPASAGGMDTENAIGSTNGAFGTPFPPDHPTHSIEVPLYRATDKTIRIDYLIATPTPGLDLADCR